VTLLQQLLAEARQDREARESERREAARERGLEREQHHATEARLREQVAARDKEILHLTGLVASLQAELKTRGLPDGAGAAGASGATTGTHPGPGGSDVAKKRKEGGKMETYEV